MYHVLARVKLEFGTNDHGMQNLQIVSEEKIRLTVEFLMSPKPIISLMLVANHIDRILQASTVLMPMVGAMLTLLCLYCIRSR